MTTPDGLCGIFDQMYRLGRGVVFPLFRASSGAQYEGRNRLTLDYRHLSQSMVVKRMQTASRQKRG